MKLSETAKQSLVNEVNSFITEKTIELILDPSWEGAWLQSGSTFNGRPLVFALRWEPGFGKELRDDCVQVPFDPEWALCLSVLLYNPFDTPAYWDFPYDPADESGDLLTESVSLDPDDLDSPARLRALAEWVVDEYEFVIDYAEKHNLDN